MYIVISTVSMRLVSGYLPLNSHAYAVPMPKLP